MYIIFTSLHVYIPNGNIFDVMYNIYKVSVSLGLVQQIMSEAAHATTAS
jgi:hypothetical protein